jgi:hypothetical protein
VTLQGILDGAVGGIVAGIVLAILLITWRFLRRPIYVGSGDVARPPPPGTQFFWSARALVTANEAKGHRRDLTGIFRRETVHPTREGEDVLVVRVEGA